MPWIIVGAAFIMAAPAFSQCQPTWSTLPHRDQATAFATYDEDGDGPAPPMLFIGGVREIGVDRGPSSPTLDVERISRGDSWQFYAADHGLEPWPPESLIGSPVSVHGAMRGVFAGGLFTHSGMLPVRSVARWTGTRWEEVGGGAEGNPRAFAFFDDGAGLVLMASNLYRLSGGKPDLFGVSRWDGGEWSLVGNGVWRGTPSRIGTTRGLTVFDEPRTQGFKRSLFVGGSFDLAGHTPVGNIARWDGKEWSTVGELGTEQGVVYSLCVFDAGDGPMLYVGGSFSRVGGPSNWITAPRLARWDGKEWSAVPGWTAPGGGNVRAMAVFDDDGDGPNKPALFITGFFAGAAGTNASSIIKWDGKTWDAMDGGLGGFGRVGETLHVFDDDGDGPNPGGLYVGGTFDTAGGVLSYGLARWGCPLTPPCLADCDFSTGFGTLDVFDFLCFLNRFHAGAPYACDCDVSTGHGVCDIFDFLCYGQRFQNGCP